MSMVDLDLFAIYIAEEHLQIKHFSLLFWLDQEISRNFINVQSSSRPEFPSIYARHTGSKT